MLQLVYDFKKGVLPKYFSNYYQSVTQTHNYSARFVSDNNLAIMKCNQSFTQFDTQVIKIEMRSAREAKTKFLFRDTSFRLHIKNFS